MSDQGCDFVGHWQILVGHCPMTDCYLQHWSGAGSSCGLGTALRSWARHFTLIMFLSTQVYKWVKVNLPLVDNPAID